MSDALRRRLSILSFCGIVLFGQQASALETSPWMTGRWSAVGCVDPSSTGTRFFTAKRTRSTNDDCRIDLKPSVGGSTYRAHLTCRYAEARDVDSADVILDVRSPMIIDWVNECIKVTYRYCGR